MAKKKYTDGVHVRVLSDGKGGKRKYNCTYKKGKMVSKKVFANKNKPKKSTKFNNKYPKDIKKVIKSKSKKKSTIKKSVKPIKWYLEKTESELVDGASLESYIGKDQVVIAVSYVSMASSWKSSNSTYELYINGDMKELSSKEVYKFISKKYGTKSISNLDLSKLEYAQYLLEEDDAYN